MSIFTRIKKRMEPADMDAVRLAARYSMSEIQEHLTALRDANPQPADTHWAFDVGGVVTWTPEMIDELVAEMDIVDGIIDGIEEPG